MKDGLEILVRPRFSCCIFILYSNVNLKRDEIGISDLDWGESWKHLHAANMELSFFGRIQSCMGRTRPNLVEEICRCGGLRYKINLCRLKMSSRFLQKKQERLGICHRAKTANLRRNLIMLADIYFPYSINLRSQRVGKRSAHSWKLAVMMLFQKRAFHVRLDIAFSLLSTIFGKISLSTANPAFVFWSEIIAGE